MAPLRTQTTKRLRDRVLADKNDDEPTRKRLRNAARRLTRGRPSVCLGHRSVDMQDLLIMRALCDALLALSPEECDAVDFVAL